MVAIRFSVAQTELYYTSPPWENYPKQWDGDKTLVLEKPPTDIAASNLIFKEPTAPDGLPQQYCSTKLSFTTKSPEKEGEAAKHTLYYQDENGNAQTSVVPNIPLPPQLGIEEGALSSQPFFAVYENQMLHVFFSGNQDGSGKTALCYLSYSPTDSQKAIWQQTTIENSHVDTFLTERTLFVDKKLYLSVSGGFIALDIGSNRLTSFDEISKQVKTIVPDSTQIAPAVALPLPIIPLGTWKGIAFFNLPVYTQDEVSHQLIFAIKDKKLVGAVHTSPKGIALYDHKLQLKNTILTDLSSPIGSISVPTA